MVLGLKKILFELEDRDMCNALPNTTVVRGLDARQVSSMRKLRRRALINQLLRREISLPNMKVPKLTAQTFDDRNPSPASVVGRQYIFAGTSLDYLLRDNEVGDYKANWLTCDEKLKF